jgi:hypothetical protein
MQHRVATTKFTELELRDHLSPLNREYPNDAIDSHAHHTLSLRLCAPLHNLHTNINRRLLSKPHNLRPGAPIPTHESLVSTCADEILGGKCNGADTVEVSGKLLKRRECDRGKKVNAANIMKPNHENLFLRQEIHTAHRLLHLQALFHLAGVDVPETDGFVIGA